MKPEIRSTIAAFYKTEIDKISTPPLPIYLTDQVGDTSSVSKAGTPGSRDAVHDFRRRLVSEIVRIALTAAIVSGAILLPTNHSINPVSLGIDRLFTDSVLQDSVSKNLLDAALMIGKSIAKE